MRLDKFFSTVGLLSRKQCLIELKRCNITVDGEIVKKPDTKIDPEKNVITYKGEKVNYKQYVYIMLNKPQGIVSATTDKNEKTVIDLLPEQYKKLDLFPCGRLDKDTTGVVILTNDGVAAHKALAPKSHVIKKYYYECADPLTEQNAASIENGILLKDGYTTHPCKLEPISPVSGYIYLDEGKYHQIKRMFGAISNKITLLKRIAFGEITLDENLKEGEFRPLTPQEEKYFTGEND